MSTEQRKASLAMIAAELVDNWSAGKARAKGVALRGDFGACLHGAVQEGMGRATDGALDDNGVIFQALWGFELVPIAVPVKVWHGAQERARPARWGALRTNS